MMSSAAKSRSDESGDDVGDRNTAGKPQSQEVGPKGAGCVKQKGLKMPNVGASTEVQQKGCRVEVMS
jgi:hypothetical protein